MPLTIQDCPLVTEDLVQLGNRLEGQFAEVEGKLPHLWAAERVRDLARRFAEVRDVMQRKRYRVGFLGRSQVGKSSTLNNVLNGSPTSAGAGAPATSNVTRIHRLAPGAKPTCRLRFMTPEEFADRRQNLCDLLGLESDKPDGELVQELGAIIHKRDRGPSGPQAAAASAVDDRMADREYFLRLLRTHQQFGPQYVRTPAHEQDGDYDRRGDYTNHPVDKDTWPYLLLREVEIGFPTDMIADKLELIDLPGLGARMEADDRLTEAFLPQLDGALVFQSSEQVQAKEAYRLLALLRKRFRRMEGRVWTVVTKFDSLDPISLQGDTNGLTILDHLCRTLDENHVPHRQVILTGNYFYKRYVKEGNRVVPGMYQDILKLEVTPEGQPLVPERLKGHEVLFGAYRKVLEDGGIREVREIIGRRLADQVQEEVRQTVRQELRAIAGELADQVEVAREQATMSFEDFENALMWEAEVRKVAYLLDTERALLETPGRHLMRQLHELFGRICPANQPLPADGLALRHRRYADILRQKVAFLARTETLPTIFNAVKARLEAGAQKERLKNVALPGHASPAAALEALRAEAAQARAWYEDDFQSFEDDDLFLDGHDDGAARDFSADEYRKVMQQKIDAVVHRAVHLMGCRVKRHLKKLEDELSWLGNGKAGVDTSSDTETFDTLIRALREVSYAP